MAKIFEPGKEADHKFVANVLKKYHGELLKEEITIGVLFVESGADDDPGPVLKHQGYPAAAVIKINSYRDRVEGKPDATIVIDRETWNDLTELEREALIDHELYHLTLTHDKDGLVKKDDLGRPKLKLRLHDFQIGGFEAIVERHGTNALEQQAFQKLAESKRQLLIPWG